MQVKNVRGFKNVLREEFRNKRLQFTAEQKSEYDRKILERVLSLSAYKQNSVILTYVSKSIEVDTIGIIRQALSDNKRVAVPKCIDGTREMEFYFIKSVDDLETGSFGVLEPRVNLCEKLTDLSLGLCIVPGMSFDTKGFRLGYGKGYYDRFLSRFSGKTVGLCYSCCIKWNLPKGKFDRSVDVIITDRYVRYTKSSCVKGNPKNG